MRPPRSHSNSAKLEKKEEKSAKRSENRNGESSSAVENHLTLDPGKISVIYTRPSLIVNSFPPPSTKSYSTIPTIPIDSITQNIF